LATSPAGAAAQAVVLADDEAVEGGGGGAGDLLDVVVAAVAGGREDADALALDVEALDQGGHGAHGRGVVAVVEDHLEGELVVDVEAAGGLEVGGIEGAQALADVLDLDAHGRRS
jgi:hypothetical protein